MKKVVLYSAMSLDGFIAGENGDLSWLDEIPNPQLTDYGYQDFNQTIDTTLMGHTTYKEILGFDMPFPYQDKTNFVFGSKADFTPNDFVTLVQTDARQRITQLKQQTGKNIWLVGGGKLNAYCLAHDLIDELILHVMPIVLGSGVKLFDGIATNFPFQLISSTPYVNGVIEVCYHKKDKNEA